MAQGPLALGLDVAVIGYTLAPEARMSEIAAEIRAALRGCGRNRAGASFVVSGWSAGGHLAALTADEADAASRSAGSSTSRRSPAPASTTPCA